MENKIIQLNRTGVVKPAMTFHQKISTFTLRTKFLKPYKGFMDMTSHSNLMEVNQETELVDHEVALASLMQLVYTTFRNNIAKCILVENITNTVIWTFYGKLDRYPYTPKWKRELDGNVFFEGYKYHAWNNGEKRFVQMPEVNLMRDHFQALQEKVTLNFEWHKAEWRKKALSQVNRELESQDSAIAQYNAAQLVTGLHRLRTAEK